MPGRREKDVDYLALSARVRAMENRLLTQERLDRMIDARDPAEAAKVLAECGYGELAELTGDGLEELLNQAQDQLARDLSSYPQAAAILPVFQCAADYHNAKTLVKGEALGWDGERMGRLLMPGGRWSSEKLLDGYQKSGLEGCTETFRLAVNRAREVLAASGDPQQADFVLDRACYKELTALAKTTGSSFLQGYAALLIDAVNLRAVVRARRLGRGADFLRQVVLDGGTIPAADLLASGGEELARLFRGSPLARAAELGGALSAAGSGSLTEFERMCDDGVMDYLRQARRIPFGEEPVIGYLCARQAEATAIRTVMSGRLAGLDGETIRGRLRRTYC